MKNQALIVLSALCFFCTTLTLRSVLTYKGLPQLEKTFCITKISQHAYIMFTFNFPLLALSEN